ncbi:MAG: hypothetical protein O7E51_01155, partial [Acidobacteria bacterium]|nr:hypothetical protein [Acidobacteriota bacterium]
PDETGISVLSFPFAQQAMSPFLSSQAHLALVTLVWYGGLKGSLIPWETARLLPRLDGNISERLHEGRGESNW